MKHNYVEAFKNSFENKNRDEIDLINSELLAYSNDKIIKEKFMQLFNQCIIINSQTSKIQKNRLLLPLFKNTVCIIFYPHLLDKELDDPELKEKFKKFMQ